MKIYILGTGNIAWLYGQKLHGKNIPIYGIYGRDSEKAETLAKAWNTTFQSRWEDIPDDADIYLFALKDGAYPEVIRKFPHRNKTMVHTSGTLPISLFEQLSPSRGVLYPFQTCTKCTDLKSERLPICVEASDTESRSTLETLAALISEEIYFLSSEQRKYLHLAGVFANNFSNAMYRISFELLEKQHIDTRLLHPLILETALKIQTLHPSEAQTGPARRQDENVMQAHLEMLKNEKPSWSEIYRILSALITDR